MIRRGLVVVLVLVLLAAVSGGVWFRASQRNIKVYPELASLRTPKVTAQTIAWPATGQAAIGIEGYSVLDSTKNQKPAATASVAKLITALCVLEKKPMQLGSKGEVLTIGTTDIDLYHSYVAQGGSIVPVNSGEQLSQYDALVALLLPSANNIADGLAIWAFGSLDAYQTYANKWVKAHGLTNTQIGTDASGLSESTTSTATDLVKLGELAHKNPIIAEIANKQSATIPVAGTVQNVNWLLGTAGITGLKTGNSDAAGGAFVFSADYEVAPGAIVTYIGAVMEATDLRAALTSSLTLLKSSQANTTSQVIVPANTIIAQYDVPSQSIVTAVNASDVKGIYWGSQALDKTIVKVNPLQPPAQQGYQVGTVSAGQDDSAVVLTSSVQKPTWWWRLTRL